jgi:hypothetical protein
MSALVTKKLSDDILKTRIKFPGLYPVYYGKKISALQGNIVIRDGESIYQGDFDIRILVNEKYPHHFPEMYEVSAKIPRTDDRHINPQGLICVEVEPKQFVIAQRGISLFQFVDEYAYNYLCGQLYFDIENKWPGDEWNHHQEGIKEYFYRIFNAQNDVSIKKFLQLIISRQIPARNNRCFCGADKKYKRCHIKTVEDIKLIPLQKLIEYEKYFLA